MQWFVFYRLYSTTNGAGMTALPRRCSFLKNRPFLAYYTCAQDYLFFYPFFCRGNQTKKIRLGLQRQEEAKCRCFAPRVLRHKRRDTPSSNIARAATAGYRCRWHRRSRSYSRQSGETARRGQCSNRKANMSCNTALGIL